MPDVSNPSCVCTHRRWDHRYDAMFGNFTSCRECECESFSKLIDRTPTPPEPDVDTVGAVGRLLSSLPGPDELADAPGASEIHDAQDPEHDDIKIYEQVREVARQHGCDCEIEVTIFRPFPGVTGVHLAHDQTCTGLMRVRGMGGMN